MTNETTVLIDADSVLFCKACSEHKVSSLFHKDRSSKRGFAYYCKVCATRKSRQWHHKHKDTLVYKRSRADSNYKTKYNLSLSEREELLVKQSNACAICLTTLKSFGGHTHTDHDHSTGRVRGLLCTNCNRGLGHFKDSTSILKSAIEYLKGSHDSCARGC